MSFQERNIVVSIVVSVVLFTGYWAVVITRAVADDSPFTGVAWQGPLLLLIAASGTLYGLAYGVRHWRARGSRTTDERDIEILARSGLVGSVGTWLAVLVALIMLALDAGTFWVAHVLLVGSFVASLGSDTYAMTGYRRGLER